MSGEGSAFTTRYDHTALRLINKILAVSGELSVEVDAKWDTGASNTCISDELAMALGLQMTGARDVITPSGTARLAAYMLDIVLPGNVRVSRVPVFGSAIAREGIDVLVGMDIISLGDFATSCKDGKTCFTFRIPSVEDADYVGSTLSE